MLVIQCFWTILSQSQLRIKSIAHNTTDSDRRKYPFNTQIQHWNPFSLASTLFMFVQYNDFMRLSSTIQFISLIVSIQSLPIYRMMKCNTFLFWTLYQTRLYQFRSSISHKFHIFILNIDHTKDWNMLAKPIWVVVKDGNESMDDWILNQWPKNDGVGFGTNKESIEYSMIIEWSEMEWNKCVDPLMELPIRISIRFTFDFDTISENGRNIYEWNPIIQTKLEIDFNWTFLNE